LPLAQGGKTILSFSVICYVVIVLELINIKGGECPLDLPLVSSLVTADGVFYFKKLS
jgi:hypothetical protein